MGLFGNSKEIENVYVNGKKIDRVFANGKLIWESTIYVEKPTVTGAYTYNTAAQSAVITGYNEAVMTISGTRSATEAGTYHVYFTLNKGYAWKDGSTAQLDYTWAIAKKSVSVPKLSATSFSWVEGATHSVVVSGIDTTYISQSGNLSQTDTASNLNVANTVTWSLKNTKSVTWTDGTTGDKSESWKAIWVNGTSHYKTDLYNCGWNSGYLAKYREADIVQFNADHIYLKASSGGSSVYCRLLDTSDSLEQGKTLHIAFTANAISGSGSTPTYAGYLAAQYWYGSTSQITAGPMLSSATKAMSSSNLSYKYSGSTTGCKYGLGIAGWTEAKVTRVWVE
jgi:hypothetical protein